jgi:hypothetical protein
MLKFQTKIIIKMAINFKNRVGDNFFIKSKLTKTGKMTYFLTKTKEESCLSSLPEGYEVYERYDLGTMFIRKVQESLFTVNEIKEINSILRKNKSLSDFQLDVCGSEIKIFSLEKTETGTIPKGFIPILINFSRYEFKMKINGFGQNDNRYFEIMRYCYRGSVDKWISIDSGPDLKQLAEENLIHLGKDSFYDLM